MRVLITHVSRVMIGGLLIAIGDDCLIYNVLSNYQRRFDKKVILLFIATCIIQ